MGDWNSSGKDGRQRALAETPEKERTLLFGARLSSEAQAVLDEHLDELERLVATAGGVAVERMTQEMRKIRPATLIGSGKVEQLRERVEELEVDSVVFDHELTPAQQRNLTDELGVKVLERAQVILDIFVRRARTSEAKVQVQLAQLEYLLPRLAGMWRHLERQRGGIGVRGGPGEAQIELDRRIIRQRLGRLKKKLDKIGTQRRTRRKRRQQVFQVALVGYTNAGKSTLLGRLTGAEVYVEDQLFATLDPMVRNLSVASSESILLIDTVGFIRKLPHQLVASFHSTLEEVLKADLLLVVADSLSEALEDHLRVVREVLGEIGAGLVPWRLVLNKIDGFTEEAAAHLRALHPEALLCSAHTGQGLPELVQFLMDSQAHWSQKRAEKYGRPATGYKDEKGQEVAL